MQEAGSLRYDLITDPTDLEQLAAELEGETIIGVDLEADSMFHFRERVCLLQIATREKSFVVDTIRITDAAPLREVFRSPRTRKVFHGADYDVRSLFRDFEIRINNLFDTELACRLLGYKESGLEAVLKNLFGVALDKKYQRKDWSRRPLPDEMLAYAAADVRHLVPLAERLEAELRSQHRLAWAAEECRLLSRVRPNTEVERPLFLNCKGAGRLDPRGLAVLEGLLGFRRKLARVKDRPLFKVFSHETLLQLAEARPATMEELEATRALSAGQLERYGLEILAVVEQALRIPSEELPRYPRRKSQTVSAAAARRIQALRRWRDAKARKLKIEPSLVCTKAAINAIAARRPASPEDLAEIVELKRWQRKAFGEEIVAAHL